LIANLIIEISGLSPRRRRDDQLPIGVSLEPLVIVELAEIEELVLCHG
jgi:hypothetical protein